MVSVTKYPDYSDLDLDFIANPTTGDIVKKTGFDAVKRSVRNLILTNFYDRPFRSYLGSNAQKILFDNVNPLSAMHLQNAVKEVLQNYEPRITVQQVNVLFDPDNNGYNLTLYYTVLNINAPVTTNIYLNNR